MGAYISMAQRCFANGEWYPMMEDVYSSYIWAPGFINYLILQLHIFGTINLNAVLNLFLNVAMLFEVYYLCKKFFSKRVGLIAVIIFCLLPSNLFIVLGANTENLFLFLCLSALCLVFSKKYKYIVLASVLFALANWIRPLAIIFLFTSVVYFAITKTKVYKYIAFIIPYVLVIFFIGAMTEKKIGYFVYQSTTSGYNLLMTSHDNAIGNFYAFGEKDVDFIDNSRLVSFAQKDSIWKERSLVWIKEHPIKFAALFFVKIPLLYFHDNWSGMSHFKHTRFVDNNRIAAVKGLLKNILLSICYYLAFLFFFYAFYINRKEIFTVKSIFLLIFITGTIITCIISVVLRYHYPFLFPVIIYAAWGVDTFVIKFSKKIAE
jgi:ABC-type multidrug transport system fused ATPase/permease subunit